MAPVVLLVMALLITGAVYAALTPTPAGATVATQTDVDAGRRGGQGGVDGPGDQQGHDKEHHRCHPVVPSVGDRLHAALSSFLVSAPRALTGSGRSHRRARSRRHRRSASSRRPRSPSWPRGARTAWRRRTGRAGRGRRAVRRSRAARGTRWSGRTPTRRGWTRWSGPPGRAGNTRTPGRRRTVSYTHLRAH